MIAQLYLSSIDLEAITAFNKFISTFFIDLVVINLRNLLADIGDTHQSNQGTMISL
jgi:hypothetical protein